jgi:2,3-bisphosphoglycerate-dependent phosphoglycerate mutase
MKMLESSFENPDLRFPGGESGCEARCRVLAVVEEALRGGPETLAIVTHGNLLTLLLSHYDPSLGFACWAHMSNPDVYRILLERNVTLVERFWVRQ